MALTTEEKRKLITDRLIVDDKIDKVNYIKMQIMLAEHRKLKAQEAVSAEREDDRYQAKKEFANRYNEQIDADRAKAAQELLEAGNAKPVTATTKEAVDESIFYFGNEGAVVVNMAIAYKKPLDALANRIDLNNRVNQLRNNLAPDERMLVPTITKAKYYDDYGVETLSDGTVRIQRKSASNPLESTLEYFFANTASNAHKILVSAVYTAASIQQDYSSKRNYANFFQLQTPVDYFLAQNSAYLNAVNKAEKKSIPDEKFMSLLTLSLLTKSAEPTEFSHYPREKQAKLDILEDILKQLKANHGNYLVKKL